MEKLTHAELQSLVQIREPHCVSIYLPTHRAGVETRQDPLRLKGLLGKVEERLTSTGMRSSDARGCLQPARQLIDDGAFWSHQADGLAILLTPSTMHHFRLPRQFPERCRVGDCFYLTPLFPLVNEDATFFILAISPRRVRLLRASRDAVRRMDVDGLPENFDELGKYIDTERLLQFHTRAAPTGKGDKARAAVFHGQGVGTDDAQWKKQLLDFCHMIDRNLKPVLADSLAPLVLAADQSLIPIYREADSYSNTSKQVVKGNPDALSEQQLRDAAWPIVREQQAESKAEVLSKFGNAAARQQASSTVEQILPAAVDGRVSALLVEDGGQLWGRFDSESRQVERAERQQDGAQELINAAAVSAYLKGADVFSYHAKQMPNGSPLAAIYRY